MGAAADGAQGAQGLDDPSPLIAYTRVWYAVPGSRPSSCAAASSQMAAVAHLRPRPAPEGGAQLHRTVVESCITWPGEKQMLFRCSDRRKRRTR